MFPISDFKNIRKIKLFLLSLLFISFIFSQDSLQVVKIYNATNGHNWINNDNWLTDKPLAEWFGITVSDSNIISIELPRNHLSGEVPSEICKLSSLINLNLSDNNLSGKLPDSLCYLQNLENLNLSHNELTGGFDSIYKSTKKLIILNLSYNKISGSIPKSIGKLNKLEILDMSNNYLNNKIPTNLFKLQRLTVLNLQGNAFVGTIPRQIGNLRQLTLLDLSRNDLTGNLPKEIGKLINLKERLAVNHNSLDGMIPKELSSLNKLEYIWLNNNQFSGILPSELGKMKSLKSLFIYQNKLVGPIPRTLGNLRDLEIFYAQNNSFGGNIPQELWFLPKLKMLKLENNRLTGTIPGDLRILQSIQSINLSNNRFYAITETISLPESLLSLNLSNNQLFCINAAGSDSVLTKFQANSIEKIQGIDNQDCSENRWLSFNIETDKIDFSYVQTDSTAKRSIWITSNNARTNILQISNFNKSSFIISDSLIKIEQDDTVMVSIAFSPIDEDIHNDVLLINDIVNNHTKFVSIFGGGIETELTVRDTSIPWKLRLHPIPFSDGTELIVKYDVPEERKINITIYNLGGRPIHSIVNDTVEIGFHTYSWDFNDEIGNKVESGEYLCVMQSGMFIQIQHLMILY